MKKQILVFAIFSSVVVGCTKTETEEETSPSSSITDSSTDETPATTSAFVPCEGGKAGAFPCDGYDLYAHINLDAMLSKSGNDCWGWTDPETGNEYVLMGLDNGTGFVDITTPEAPKYLGKLPTATDSSIWRDIKVYQNHAYIVSEAPGHGMQVFDLTKLRGVTEAQTFTADSRNTSFGNAHNIALNEASGYAYVIGSGLENGGPVFFDLSNFKNPTNVGGYRFSGYSHDAQIVNYQGPDDEFSGIELYLGSHSDGSSYNKLVLLDVSNKETPRLIAEMSYPSPGYTHQSWITEDHRYIILGDELDESKFGGKTRSVVIDVSDLDNPSLHHTYLGVTNAIDHNGYVKDDHFYLANYTAGFRAITLAELENGKMQEVGFFDTYPANDRTAFDGAWNVYPFFESGIIAVSDLNSGLFLIKKKE